MPTELALAIQQICEEKNLSPEAVKETIESAISSAYRKDFGNKQQNLKVNFNMETGQFEVFDIKQVVDDKLKEDYEKRKEEIEKLRAEGKEEELKTLLEKEKEELEKETEDEEKEKRFNPKIMISLSDAKEEKKSAKLGDELIRKLEVPADFGRMAAQTAKQVIIQKIREAERESIFSNYKEKQGELINGTVQRREGRVVLVDVGETTAVMPPQDQIEKEIYKPGAKMKFYLKNVEQTPKGPEVIVSRTHPEMIRKLFKLEVPEINSSTVQIKAIAREAGSRSKVAVVAKDESVDPIGSCVGQRGTRVQTIINELGGEKIDIIEWEEDVESFIIKSLAPAKILEVKLDEESKIAKALVKEDQYSLAIGKEGQNARLAAKLTGWKIDIISEGGVEKKTEEEEKQETKEVKEAEGVKGVDKGEKKQKEIKKLSNEPARNTSHSDAGGEIKGKDKAEAEASDEDKKQKTKTAKQDKKGEVELKDDKKDKE